MSDADFHFPKCDMATRVRDFDWGGTALGPIEGWPAPLRTIVDFTLASPMIASVVVGPERILIYNDASAAHCRPKHPCALGRPLGDTFDEFSSVAPFYDRVFAGEGVHVPAQPLDPSGNAPEVYEAFLTPVRDEAGCVIAAHMTGCAIGTQLRAEAASRASEAQLALAIDIGRIGHWEFDLVTREFTTSAHCRLNYARPADVTLSYDDLVASIHPDDRGRQAQAVSTAVEGKSEFEVEYRIVTPQAEVQWVLVRGRYDESNGPRLVGVSQNITARKGVDVVLRDSERRLRQREADLARVQRIGGIGGIDIEVRPGLRSRRSPEYLCVHGLPPDTVEEGHEDWLARLHPDDRDEAEQALFAALASTSPSYELEYRIIRPNDGETRWIAARADIERDADGKALRLVGAHIDITEQKHVQEALSASEARLREFGEASQDVLWTRDPENLQWRYLTPAFDGIYGISREEALTGDNYRSWLDFVVPEDREHTVASIDRVRHGEHVTFEFRIRRPSDGTIRWMRNTDFPIRDSSGKVVLIGGIGHDMTDVKQIQQRLELLVAELQHRVRNMLTIVRSVFLQTIESGGDLESVADHFSGRLDALARTQVIVTQTATGLVDLENLIRDELLSVGAGDGPTLTIAGPEVQLHSKEAESIGLAIHELTTNAIKYGALKHSDSVLNISWELDTNYGGGGMLTLNWLETGVPAVSLQPIRSGFGRELIEQALPYRLKARTKLDIRGGGVRCTIEIPLPDPTDGGI